MVDLVPQLGEHRDKILVAGCGVSVFDIFQYRIE